MATHRDEVRASRGVLNRKGQQLGIKVDAERSKIGSNQRTLAFDTLKLINDQTPRVTRESQQVDDPPAGVFDGLNTTFVLSEPVVGINISVIWGDTATPQTIPLTRTDTNPPPINSFFFDVSDPTVIIVGNPPLPADRLIAVYRVER